jgi:fucose 4-O-acetylase-like acetyltransferase
MSSTIVAPPVSTPAETTWSGAVLQRLRALSYYSTADFANRRDLRVDLLRGFCIFAMVVDHFGGDSWLYAITGGNRFYVSAAEGFIFISGFIMGQAYRAKRDRSGLPAAMGDALRRARTLYIATVAMTLIFSALYLYTDITLWTGRDFGLGIDSWQEILVAAVTLHYTYHGTDILAMYTILLMVAPLMLLMLSIGEWWVVLIPSWLLWLIYQVYPEEAAVPWYIRHGENFPIAAWQVLFVTGHVLGFYRGALTAWLQRFRRVRVMLVAIGLAITLGLISLVLQGRATPSANRGVHVGGDRRVHQRHVSVGAPAARTWLVDAAARAGGAVLLHRPLLSDRAGLQPGADTGEPARRRTPGAAQRAAASGRGAHPVGPRAQARALRHRPQLSLLLQSQSPCTSIEGVRSSET